MNIEVITIGNEILAGAILDTNFSYLATRLREEGYSVARHTSIPDDSLVMELCLNDAMTRSTFILTTGGLGPTLDDKTKEVMAKIFNKKLAIDEKIKEELIQRYGPELTSLDHQSTVPVDTIILENRVGTAPGFLFRKNEVFCFVMPGVPVEMQTMFETEVLPHIKIALQGKEKNLVRLIHLWNLSENILDPYLRELDQKYPDVAIGIYPGYGVLSIEFKIQDTPNAANILELCVDTLVRKFGNYIFSQKERSLSLALHRTMIEQKKTLVLAESCTGGHIAAKLVDHVGASEYFLGGIVCYSNELKKRSLGVQEKTLSQYGAVSYEVVDEMLQGALAISGADYALAVSGIFGPSGGTVEQPVGTVWCGLGVKGKKPYIGKILAKGRAKRASMIEYTANFMLGMLWRKVVYNINTL